MAQDAWYAGSVAFVLEKGLFKGVSETSFAPSATRTRAQLATILYRLAGEPAATAAAAFGDVDAQSWHGAAVSWAASAGTVTGDGQSFNPSGEMTRDHLVVMLYRHAASIDPKLTKKTGEITSFADAETVREWAKPAMAWPLHTAS